MYVIQINDGLECHGEIVAKGETIDKAVANWFKNDDYLTDGQIIVINPVHGLISTYLEERDIKNQNICNSYKITTL